MTSEYDYTSILFSRYVTAGIFPITFLQPVNGNKTQSWIEL